MNVRTAILTILFFCLCHVNLFGQAKVEQEGITYKITSHNTASVVDCSRKIEGEVIVPSVIVLDGKKYTVTKVTENAFGNCKKITHLTLPNSIKEIRANAFWNCSNLQELVVPDYCTIKTMMSSYSPFVNCHNLSRIKGHKVLAPQWIVTHIEEIGSNLIGSKAKRRLKESFTKEIVITDKGFKLFAKQIVEQEMIEWQKKSEFETTPQYKERMSEENRKRKLQELVNGAKDDYIRANAPDNLSYTLGTYNADAGVFPIISNITGLDTMFVQVPLSEAPQFKEDWRNVKIESTFGVVEDRFNLLACKAVWKGKNYESTKHIIDTALDLTISLPPLEIEIGDEGETEIKEKIVDKSVDENIPTTLGNNSHSFAVIIGNEAYQQVSKVPYAKNDAQIFAKYCQKTLGLPKENIRCYNDLTYGNMLNAIGTLQNIANTNDDINIIFYYAGHGIPNEETKDTYLLPVDANGRQTEACYSLKRLYKELGEMNARQTTVFIDACFSGANRGNGMLANARGVAIKPREADPQGKMVVFAAAKDNETAWPYAEKVHGLFTYFLLKKLQETKGNCTLEELQSYVKSNVSQKSSVINDKPQTPTVTSSISVGDNWKEWKLK